MLDYSVSSRRNPMDKDAAPRFYASAQCNKVVSLDEFAKHIASHGSVYKRAAIGAVLTMAVDCLREMLLNGYKVGLGDLGSFYVSLSSEGTATPNDFNPAIHIKSVNVIWERGTDFNNLKDEAEYNQVAIRAVQKKVLKAVKNGETTVSIVDEEEEDSTEEGTEAGA